MTLQQRQAKLIEKISIIKDAEALSMLEQELSFFTHFNGTDIADNLTAYQVKELISLVNELSDLDVIDETGYRNITAKWRSK